MYLLSAIYICIPLRVDSEHCNYTSLKAYFKIYFLFIRAQNFFLWNPGNLTNPQPSYFNFKSIIENLGMKVGILYLLNDFKDVFQLSLRNCLTLIKFKKLEKIIFKLTGRIQRACNSYSG